MYYIIKYANQNTKYAKQNTKCAISIKRVRQNTNIDLHCFVANLRTFLAYLIPGLKDMVAYQKWQIWGMHIAQWTREAMTVGRLSSAIWKGAKTYIFRKDQTKRDRVGEFIFSPWITFSRTIIMRAHITEDHWYWEDWYGTFFI